VVSAWTARSLRPLHSPFDGRRSHSQGLSLGGLDRVGRAGTARLRGRRTRTNDGRGRGHRKFDGPRPYQHAPRPDGRCSIRDRPVHRSRRVVVRNASHVAALTGQRQRPRPQSPAQVASGPRGDSSTATKTTMAVADLGHRTGALHPVPARRLDARAAVSAGRVCCPPRQHVTDLQRDVRRRRSSRPDAAALRTS